MAADITTAVDTIFSAPDSWKRAPSHIIIWDAKTAPGGGRRGIRPMPEWLNSLLISTVPSEVRR